MQQFYQGPLPPPEAFEHYNHITPGAAERILIMAEEEQRQRHQVEMLDATNNATIKLQMISERSRGQWMAFGIALIMPLAGTFLIFNGFSVTGTILGSAGLVPVIYAFIPKKR